MLLLGSALLRVVRGGDLVGRAGPAIFAVLAADASAAGASRLAERLHAALPATLTSPQGPVPLRVAIGIAGMPEAGSTLPELLPKAQQALQEALRSGRTSSFFDPAAATETAGSRSLEGQRRDELARLSAAYTRQEIAGIVLRTQASACSVCVDASRDVYQPHLAPIPALPLLGCTSPEGCRCFYSAPEQDPRRAPPPVPAHMLGRFEVPRRLRDASQFGADPKKRCKSEELAEYLEHFPLLPIEAPLPLQPREVAYLVREGGWAQLHPRLDEAARPEVTFPLTGGLRSWAQHPGGPRALPKDALWQQEEGLICLTNWRLLFRRAGAPRATGSILLADLQELEYLREGLACRVAGENWRTVVLLREPLLCGLYITKSVRDVALLTT